MRWLLLKTKEQLLKELKMLFIAPNITTKQMCNIKNCYKEIKNAECITNKHEAMVKQFTK